MRPARHWSLRLIARVFLLLLVAAAAAGAQQTAAAQQTDTTPWRRSGLWAEIGIGWGSLRVSSAGVEEVTTSPGAWSYVRLGGSVSRHVYLGAETAGFFDDSFLTSDTTTLAAEVEALSFIAVWFPTKLGLFFKGGLGMAQGRFTVVRDSTSEIFRGTGLNINWGVGWDFPIGRRLSITSNLSSTVVGIGDFLVAGGTETVEDVIGTVYALSVGVTFR